MFDEQQRPNTKFNVKAPLIALACGGVGILLSFGLCGANVMMGQRAFVGIAVPSLARAGVVLFVLSLVAIAVSIVWILALCIINSIRS